MKLPTIILFRPPNFASYLIYQYMCAMVVTPECILQFQSNQTRNSNEYIEYKCIVFPLDMHPTENILLNATMRAGAIYHFSYAPCLINGTMKDDFGHEAQHPIYVLDIAGNDRKPMLSGNVV